MEFTTSVMLAVAGERLIKRLRAQTFRAILAQEIGYFDDPKNTTGALCARLATDASSASKATGTQAGLMIQNIANMGTAIIIAFVYGWQMTLLIFAFIPFLVLGGYLHMKLLAGGSKADAGKCHGQADHVKK